MVPRRTTSAAAACRTPAVCGLAFAVVRNPLDRSPRQPYAENIPQRCLDLMSTVPDTHGRFGPYGGRYVPETLMHALRQLTEYYEQARQDPEFQKLLDYYLRQYVGRPSSLYFAERLTAEAGGARIFLKREDLNHTGAHKINNCIGQALLAKRMGKPRIIAETGAGQHG